MSVAILLSGNNYQKIATLSKFLKLPIVSSSTFHKIQRTYMIPSIDRFWIQEQESVISQFRDQEMILLGLFFLHVLHFSKGCDIAFLCWCGVKSQKWIHQYFIFQRNNLYDFNKYKDRNWCILNASMLYCFNNQFTNE